MVCFTSLCVAFHRMFSISQQTFRSLNPGVGFEPEKGTVLCVKGQVGVSSAITVGAVEGGRGRWGKGGTHTRQTRTVPDLNQWLGS